MSTNVQILSPINRANQDKALYTSADPRRNLFDNSINEVVKRKAVSVACLIGNDMLKEKKDTYQYVSQTLEERIQKTQKAALGPNEAFRNEPSVGNGTAFLVGSKLALTAAHCVCSESSSGIMSVDNTKKAVQLVFGFQMSTATTWETEIPKDKVYSIETVVKHSLKKDAGDWALLKLDREVKGIPSLGLDFINEVIDSQEIYMLGHPYGLPIKFTEGRVMPSQQPTTTTAFQAEIDAFAGNSGSPIFNKITNKVVGMLVSGKKDWEIDNQGKATAHQVTQQEIKQDGYEKCQKMSSLPMSIIQQIDPSQLEKQTTIDKLWEQVCSLFGRNKALEAIECFNNATKDGLDCRYYEVAAFIQDKHPELASTIAANYLEKARMTGFVPASIASNEKKLSINNKGVQMSGDADMTNITEKDGTINNQNANIRDQSLLTNLSGEGGSSSNINLSMQGNSQLINVANDREGKTFALEQLKQKFRNVGNKNS